MAGSDSGEESAKIKKTVANVEPEPEADDDEEETDEEKPKAP